MRMRRALLFLAALASVAVPSTAGPSIAAAAAEQSFTIAALPNDSSGEVYYASEMGFFKKNGLNANVMTLSAGAISSAVISGTAAIGTLTVPAVALARSKGIPLVIIAPASVYSSAHPTSGIIVLKDSPIHKAADLNGKVVATRDISNLSYYGAKAWVDANGGDSNSVKWVEIPDTEDVAAMQQGRVVAGSVSEPALDIALQGGARMLAPVYDAIGKQFLIACYFTTEQYAKAHPDVVRQFAASIMQTAKWANANHARTAQIIAKYGGGTIAPSMTRVTYAETIRPADAQPVLDMLTRYGVLKDKMKASEIFAPEIL